MTRTMSPARRRTSALAAVLVIGLGALLSACGEDAEPTDSPSPSTSTSPSTTETPSSTESASPTGQKIDITFDGDTVTPSGERVDAEVGKEITLHVTADAPGEIHVHSTPEQELEYDAGTTDLSLTIDQPGLVDVESHDLDMVIVQLEVR